MHMHETGLAKALRRCLVGRRGNGRKVRRLKAGKRGKIPCIGDKGKWRKVWKSAQQPC